MYKCIRNFILLTLLVGSSSFSLNASNPLSNCLPAIQQTTKKIVHWVNADQTGPITITGTWDSDLPFPGVFTARCFDVTGGGAIQVGIKATTDHFAVFEGLIIGHTYRVNVTDHNYTWLSRARLVTY